MPTIPADVAVDGDIAPVERELRENTIDLLVNNAEWDRASGQPIWPMQAQLPL